MKKQPEIFLQHMLTAIKQIESYIKDYNEESFNNDPKTIDAVIRQFEIIGEAAKNVPNNLTKDSPISWDKIVGLRNKLIHVYFGVDVSIVWQTASQGLKPLKKFIEDKLSNFFQL